MGRATSSERAKEMTITPIEHELILTYHYQDDGVWLQCSCTWEINLGFNATPEDAADAGRRHVLLGSSEGHADETP